MCKGWVVSRLKAKVRVRRHSILPMSKPPADYLLKLKERLEMLTRDEKKSANPVPPAIPEGLSAVTSFLPSERITQSFQRLRLSFLLPFHPIRNHVHNGRCSTNQAVASVYEEKP